MKKYILVLLLVLSACSTNEDKQVSIMQFNVWQEGTKVPNGYPAIVNEITEYSPDFVTLSEVRHYNDVNFLEKLITDLKAKGITYYFQMSDDAAILSKYPLTSFTTIYSNMNKVGKVFENVVKLTTEIDGVPFAVYSAHLDYKNYAVLLPRGYDGSVFGVGDTFKKMDAPVTDIALIEKQNLASMRDDSVAAIVKDMQADIANGTIVLIGGDYNEPSHLDWTEETKDLYSHNGVVFNWNSTATLEKAGFVDSYRKLYPSAVTHPGFTYPADNTNLSAADRGMLTWAPEADERERIDFIHFYPNPKIALKSSVIVGPKNTIAYNKTYVENTEDNIVNPLGVWPSDHKVVVTTFDFAPKK